MKVVCIKHPNYDGTTAPKLSCKACCEIFLLQLAQGNKKAKEVREKRRASC